MGRPIGHAIGLGCVEPDCEMPDCKGFGFPCFASIVMRPARCFEAVLIKTKGILDPNSLGFRTNVSIAAEYGEVEVVPREATMLDIVAEKQLLVDSISQLSRQSEESRCMHGQSLEVVERRALKKGKHSQWVLGKSPKCTGSIYIERICYIEISSL